MRILNLVLFCLVSQAFARGNFQETLTFQQKMKIDKLLIELGVYRERSIKDKHATPESFGRATLAPTINELDFLYDQKKRSPLPDEIRRVYPQYEFRHNDFVKSFVTLRREFLPKLLAQMGIRGSYPKCAFREVRACAFHAVDAGQGSYLPNYIYCLNERSWNVRSDPKCFRQLQSYISRLGGE